jgi:hypothetical protein
MDVFVIEGVLHVTVQVTYVRTRLDGELLVNVLGPDEFAPLLPEKLSQNVITKLSQNFRLLYKIVTWCC